MRPLLRFEPSPPPLFATLPELRLLDQGGEPFPRSALEGRVTVAGFFSTGCRSECPRLLAALESLESRYRDEGIDGVGLLAITVDPEHDSPEVLARFAAERRLDPGRWSLLTGSEVEIRRLLLEGFRAGDPLVRAKAASGDAGGATGPGEPLSLVDFAHQMRVVLLDSGGGIRGFYRTDEAGLDEVFHRSRHVLAERRPPRPVRWPAAPGAQPPTP
ncbi:MAG TPA: SCO family protein [Thermoanaerobaculia bacterium]|nr:SCO family protein [Thermoanaerobaculia bacterium]